MNEKRMFKILKKLLDKNEINFISDYIIYKHNDNFYELYGTHTISENNGVYRVNKNKTYTTLDFNNLRNAVIWIVMDKTNNIVAQKKIVELDIQYTGNLIEIEQQKRLRESIDLEKKTLAIAKIKECLYKNDKIYEEIQYFTNLSNRWQNNKFNQLIKTS